jgi:hypothetical protein
VIVLVISLFIFAGDKDNTGEASSSNQNKVSNIDSAPKITTNHLNIDQFILFEY